MLQDFCLHMYQSIIEEIKQMTWNIFCKGKQGSAISGVVEREYTEFMREHPSRGSLVKFTA